MWGSWAYRQGGQYGGEERDSGIDATNDDPVVTGKIALAHLRELPDYYTRLAEMEAEASS